MTAGSHQKRAEKDGDVLFSAVTADYNRTLLSCADNGGDFNLAFRKRRTLEGGIKL